MGWGGGRVIEILKSLMGASSKFYHMTQSSISPKETTSTEIKKIDSLSTTEAAGTSKPT